MVLLNEKSKCNVYIIIWRAKTKIINAICACMYVFTGMEKGVEKGVEWGINKRFLLIYL